MAKYPRGLPPPTQIIAVLAIIGVVYAILFPVFQKVDNSPRRRSACSSNLKQLGLAMIQYEQDSNGNFPAGVTASGSGWAGQFYAYTQSTGIYKCPADQRHSKYISYAENHSLVGCKQGDLANPPSTVALYEFTTPRCDPSTRETVSATGLSAPQDSTRHDSGTPETHYALNFLTADGHVKYLTPDEVSGGVGAVSPAKLPQGAMIKTFAVK